MSALTDILETFRKSSQSEREKGAYFENLVKVYLQNEPIYKDQFNGNVFLWEEWRRYWMSLGNADPQADAGIDLVAVEDIQENPKIFAIQAKFYAEDSKIRKSDGIDSFLSAMGKQPYTHGLLFLTAYEASHHVIAAIQERDKPVNIIDVFALEASVVDWGAWFKKQTVRLKETKHLRDYQKTAVAQVVAGLQEADRGKLIMACGTGKTFTSLRLAEELAGAGGRVLFLVPSLALLSQSLTEWTQESATPLHSFAVCSDPKVGLNETEDISTRDLAFPAHTNAKQLARQFEAMGKVAKDGMFAIFSTYQSIAVVAEAQMHGLPNSI